MKTIVKFLLLIFIALPLSAQNNGALSVRKDDSSVKIEGTSSLHDWEEFVTDYTIDGNLSGDQLENLVIKIKTESIESGHSSIMDDKTHEALKAKKYPWITFKAPSMVISDSQIKGTGKLELGGQSKSITATSTIKEATDQYLLVAGSLVINMKEYGIEPPTAMFGTLTTGEVVTIKYEFKLLLQ